MSLGLFFFPLWQFCPLFSLFKKNIYFGYAGSSLLLKLFSSCSQRRPLSSCSTQPPHCGGFSCWRAQALGCSGFSSCSSWALENRLSSCGAWVQLLHSMWDLPSPGSKPVSPALAGRFFTTEPPWKSLAYFSIRLFIFFLLICRKYLHILITIFDNSMCYKYFLPVWDLSFHYLQGKTSLF